DCFDAFRATFPAGTLTGAPKIRAMEIIEELEPVRRGVYGGAVGYFAFSGAMDTAITIRTALVKGGRVYIQAGAGIVADSEREAGISVPLIQRFAGTIPILGVCLGHQAIGAAFGGAIVRAARIMHGKTSLIHHDGRRLFAGLPEPFEATRYHSLVIDPAALPPMLERTAWTDAG